jgi:glycine oxidase
VKKDILVVGQGIAGTVLTLLLEEAGYDVQIIDKGHQGSSSMVAAGMWNPISFKRLVFSWRNSDLLPLVYTTYPRFEEKLKASFFHPMPLIRLFPDHASANDWDTKPLLSDYLTHQRDEIVDKYVKAPFGYGSVEKCGWLDLPVFLDAARRYFSEKGMLLEEEVSEKEIESTPNYVSVKNYSADRLVVCNGSLLDTWNMFSHIPLIRTKGQVLDLHTRGFSPKSIINFGHFMIPKDENTIRLGSTYEWDATDEVPTEEVRQLLTSSLEAHCQVSWTLGHHRAGFRPAMRDRRPVTGFLPQAPRVGMLNGLGSKGVMLAPFVATQLVSHLQTGAPIDKEIDHTRFYR